MNFEDLHAMIPYAKGGKTKILTMKPYPEITLAMPGKHALETIPIGGDFVVMVTDTSVGWLNHQFKHDDIFSDLEEKTQKQPEATKKLVKYYGAVVLGMDPVECDGAMESLRGIGVNPYIFMRAVQCLAVAEHRRYAKFEGKIGGRYLPFRFACGIVEERWTAVDAIGLQKMGRPGVEMLEKQNGVPNQTKELFECLNKN